jgi:outer membrane protein assembly factor BamB
VVYCGSADGYLYALNYSDGRLLWKFKAGSHIINTPVVINDSIYFGSCDNKFYCLSTEGIKRWDFLTGDVITCYPAVADQKGNIVWNPALYCSQRITEKIKLDSGSILFGCDDTFFYSIDIDGKLRWKIKTGDRIRGTNTSVFNGQVFFGSYDRNLRCVSFDSGRLKWSFMAGGPIVNNNIYGKNIYFGSYDGIFHAITIDGKSLWEFQTGGPIPSCPIIIDDVVYFGSWDTYFYALSLKTQKPLWKFQTGFGFQSPVKLANVIAISDKKTEINWVPETKTINEYGKVVSEPTAGSLNPYKQKGGYFVDKSREGKKSGAYT